MKINFRNIKHVTILILAIILVILKFITTNQIKEAYKVLEETEKYIVEPNKNKKYDCRVNRVIDGDTIEVSFIKEKKDGWSETEKIRLVGVNTPELNSQNNKPKEYFSEEAYSFTKQELNGQYIQIQLDNVSAERDKYGRLLAYVYINNFMFNKILIERGFARYYPNFEFNNENMEVFNQAEIYAKQNKIGMWK